MTLVEPGMSECEESDGPIASPHGAVAPISVAGSDPPGRVHGWRSLLVGALGYLALSVALWWNVWSTHPTSVTTCGCGDSSLFTWFIEWPAYALSHGLNPFYSSYLFHPGGVNLLSNTAEVGFGIVLAPVTWTVGPIATLNVALTLSPVMSALTMFVLLRRWVSWSPAAFVGGLLYGFSPFVIVSLTDAHLMLGMAAVPPLIVLCLDEVLVRQRWRWWVTGLAVGLLALVQFSVGTELLVLSAIAAAIGACLVVAHAAVFDRDVLVARAPYALRATGAAVTSSLLVLAWPVWFALAGPAHLSGNVWGSSLLSYGGNSFRFFVHPMAPLDTVTALTHHVGGYQAPSLSGQYFGIGLLAVLAAGLVIWRRDRRLWLLASVGVVCTLLSLGLLLHGWTLWRLFVRAPLMENVIPSRFVLFTYLCAAAMLGITVDHVHRATAGRNQGENGRAVLGWCAGMAVAAVALVPVVSYLADGLPLTAVPVQLPDWFATVAPDLPPNQVLLVFPFAFRQSNMTWQAVDRMRYAMVGGGGPNSLLSRAGKEREGDRYLAYLSFAGGSQAIVPGEVSAVRSALDGWGVTGIVLPDPKRLAEYARTAAVRSVVVLTTAAIGQAPTFRAHAWVWSGVDRAGPAVNPTAAQLATCAAGTADGSVASIQTSATCILGPTPAP
jgi:hypothetical protein